jgi:hypothetical protein
LSSMSVGASMTTRTCSKRNINTTQTLSTAQDFFKALQMPFLVLRRRKARTRTTRTRKIRTISITSSWRKKML